MSDNLTSTSERKIAELNGPRAAECVVTVTKKEGVASLAISGVVPQGPPDGEYKATVEGKPPSRWRRNRDGWARLG
jgi:hypothetical protein